MLEPEGRVSTSTAAISELSPSQPRMQARDYRYGPAGYLTVGVQLPQRALVGAHMW